MSKEKLNRIRELMEDYPTVTKAYINVKRCNKDYNPPMHVVKSEFVDMVKVFREKLETILRYT